jgi:hypothetical protein
MSHTELEYLEKVVREQERGSTIDDLLALLNEPLIDMDHPYNLICDKHMICPDLVNNYLEHHKNVHVIYEKGGK